MTQVTIPRSSSTNNGGRAPASGSAADNDRSIPRTMDDTVLPSIEGVSDGLSASATASTSDMRVPSLSLTPSETPFDYISTPTSDRTSVTHNAGIQNLDSDLQGLRLSETRPMDMSSVAGALQEVAAGSDSRTGSLLEARPRDSMSPSPRRLSAHRRRSSSRNIVERHDVRDEAPPNDPFNNPTFQRGYCDAKRLISELVGILGSSAVHTQPDSVMQRLYGEAQDLSRFQCPPSRTVGLIGPSGAGKSSLLNSLLDCRDLTRTSSGGAACTCAVTEYHFHPENGISIEIEQFSEDEMIAQLKSHLQGYRHFHLNGNSMNSEGYYDSERYKDFENRAQIAIDTFRAIFGGSRVGVPLLTSNTEEHVLGLFRQWVRDSGPANIHEKQRELTPDECSALLIRLTSENASAAGPAVWPWIKKIKVYSNSCILSKGLILVDLPGLEDSNAARRHITESYFKKCDEIFIVCIEDRAVTNLGVRNVVELARDANLSNVSIVCTKSDAYNDPVEAQRDFPGHTADVIKEKVEVKAQFISKEREIEAELKEYEQEMEGVGYEELTEEESRDFNQLNRRLREIRRHRTELEFDLQRFLITTCNTSVKDNLNTEFAHHFPDGTLNVFCVSNKIYWDHREAPKDVAIRHLKLSGILALREHGMAMVSQSQFAAAKKYMRNGIGKLLEELSLWVQSGHGSLSAEQKQNMRNTLDTLERGLQRELCGRSSELQNIAKEYKDIFHAKIYHPQIGHVATWRAAACRASFEWTFFHHSSYDAFCRKFGDHSVNGQNLRQWNKEIIERMVTDLSPLWSDVDMSVTGTNDNILEGIYGLFDRASEFLESKLDDSSDTTMTLISTLDSYKEQLRDSVEAVFDEFQGDLRTLRTDAMSSLRSSYIGKAMEQAYSSAGYQHGRGRHARQKSIINAMVERDDLFADLLREFRKDFREQADKTQDLVRAVVSSHLDDIKGTFNIVRDENAATECESDLAFKNRVEEGLRVTRDEMKKIYDVLGF